MENLIIKNAAGTDKTFTALVPAAGDGSIAKWALQEGLTSAAWPHIMAVSTANGALSRKGTVRMTVPYAYIDPVTSLPVVTDSFFGKIETVLPANLPEALRPDAAAFFGNMAALAVMKAFWRDAYPFTA